MRARCEHDGHHAYDNYGGRGVIVCARWASFENFLADMDERPPGKTLDRFPNKDGNYEPGNCRWATMREQNQNKRTTMTPDQVREARRLLADGMLQKHVAMTLGVASGNISNIARGVTFTDVV